MNFVPFVIIFLCVLCVKSFDFLSVLPKGCLRHLC